MISVFGVCQNTNCYVLDERKVLRDLFDDPATIVRSCSSPAKRHSLASMLGIEGEHA